MRTAIPFHEEDKDSPGHLAENLTLSAVRVHEDLCETGEHIYGIFVAYLFDVFAFLMCLFFTEWDLLPTPHRRKLVPLCTLPFKCPVGVDDV